MERAFLLICWHEEFVSEQKCMPAVALFLQQFVIHAVYRHTEEEGNEIFVGSFLAYLLQGHNIILAIGLADNDYRMARPHEYEV